MKSTARSYIALARDHAEEVENELRAVEHEVYSQPQSAHRCTWVLPSQQQ